MDYRTIVRKGLARGKSGYCCVLKRNNRMNLRCSVVVFAPVVGVEREVALAPHWIKT